MSYWSELVEDLAEGEEDLPRDQVADLWILLGSRSGSYPVGTALVALADVDVAVRAIWHLAAPVDPRLSNASRRFLRNLVAHSSERDLDVWLQASRQAFEATGSVANPEGVIAELRAALAEAGNEHRWVVAPPGSGKSHVVLRFLAEQLSPDERLTAAAELASLHPDLEEEESAGIRSLLATVAVRDRLVDELAGDPRQVVRAEDFADSLLRQARIAGEAMASIWEYPMLEPSAAAVALGAKPANREKVRTYRERSWLLGLPKGRGFMYPRFQFDPQTHDVYPEVRSANELLGAANDSWGVASWWIAPNDRVNARPVDLVGTARAAEVVHAAEALLEPVG